MVLETQLTAVLQVGFQVLATVSLSSVDVSADPPDEIDRCLFLSVILLVDSLYAESTGAVKSRAALSASIPELIRILGDMPGFETACSL
jgi:hypothetical protein